MTTKFAVAVRTKDQSLNDKRKAYMLTHFPNWAKQIPGQPGFVNWDTFKKACVQLNTLAVDAQVSMSGRHWPADDLETLRARPVEGLLRLMNRRGYPDELVLSYFDECFKQGIRK